MVAKANTGEKAPVTLINDGAENDVSAAIVGENTPFICCMLPSASVVMAGSTKASS